MPRQKHRNVLASPRGHEPDALEVPSDVTSSSASQARRSSTHILQWSLLTSFNCVLFHGFVSRSGCVIKSSGIEARKERLR